MRSSTVNSFKARNDKLIFKNILQKYSTEEELKILFASNFFYNPETWIGDMSGDKAVQNYYRMRGFLESVEYNVLNDTKILLSERSFSAGLYTNGNVPYTISCALKNTINPCTVIIYDKLFSILDYIDKNMEDSNVIWDSIYHRFSKFAHFVTVQNGQVLNDINDKLKHLIMEQQAYKTYNKEE